MERMLVVVFDNEKKAYDGSIALKTLDFEGSISVYSEAVIEKNDDGTVVIKQMGEDFPISTVSGTAIGALIGLLGGPIGVAVGAVGGTFAGSIWDMSRAGVNAEFLDDVSAKLTPGKWAIVSEISEEWVIPVDTKMEALGGTVFRIERRDVVDEQNAREVAAIKADVAQLKAEQAKSLAEDKAKLQTKIDDLNQKLDAKAEQAKQWSEQREKEAKAKVKALEKRAAEDKGKAKAAIEKRIAEIKDKLKKTSED
ncbi:membrane protein [Methanolobus psychrophilus R15]|nr:membrane protein [Methanolobus psychrophilus R15]